MQIKEAEKLRVQKYAVYKKVNNTRKKGLSFTKN
ncbi:Uncharacterised protein [Streptococcus hyointestinalis]|uniref:Uncharacterized protein n=1 Tax=Streptococcus hyointestinalis TaxID=1337 RepID=A0A380KAN0_9STRE|nr:Uncharacterised protein [Streptococcus hyointestinalis]